MGSTATLIGAVAVVTAVICLFGGFLWGRSNVKSQVEDALDQARVSADAREFALREQLDDQMFELAQLRARAEEGPRSQEQPVHLDVTHGQRSATDEPGDTTLATQNLPGQKQPATPVIDSTEKTIQNLLKSIEEKAKSEEAPQVVIQASANSAPAREPVQQPQAVAQRTSRPAPAALPAVKSPSSAKDEWQDFAASLEALTRRAK